MDYAYLHVMDLFSPLPWKTWSEYVKTDVNECGLAGIDPLDRDAWRAGIQHNLVLPTP